LICFGKNQSNSNLICGGRGECVDSEPFNKCNCNYFFHFGEECQTDLFFILPIIFLFFLVLVLCLCVFIGFKIIDLRIKTYQNKKKNKIKNYSINSSELISLLHDENNINIEDFEFQLDNGKKVLIGILNINERKRYKLQRL
jgi:hypothetical protein